MNDAASKRDLPVLDPLHDARHRLRDLPLERESMPYVISLPEQGIATCIYTWVNKNNQAGALFVVCGPAVGDEPIMEVADDIGVGPDADFDDWRVGPVHLEADLRFQQARVRAKGERIGLDVRFDALHPAYAYSFHPEGCPAFAATDRIEQSARAKGSLSIAGRTYGFDTTGARDHSWGTRDWAAAQHWKWLHAQSGEDAVHFWQIMIGGRIVLRGYVFRDGEMAEVESVDVAFETTTGYRQKTIRARIRDTAGRETIVDGEYFGHFAFNPAENCTLVEGGMRCAINGRTGAGWSEFMWPADYLEHMARTS